MKKTLSEMSLEELWQLFPIILKEHNPAYKQWYFVEKENILNCLHGIDVVRINHIGSSAVPGLIAKPTVDILLEVDRSCDVDQLKNCLINAGWVLMSCENKPDWRLIFNKGYTPNGFAQKVYHLHVRYYGDWDELYFRDYLLCHKEIAEAYGKLKLSLWKQYEHNRDGYTKAKTEFIQKYTSRARNEFRNKYI